MNAERSRLYWRCRRGMLELDEVLGAFLDGCYEGLTVAERHAFEALLNCPDELLLKYLLGCKNPEDPAMRHVVSKIRRADTH